MTWSLERHFSIGRIFTGAGISNELWYNTLKNGERKTIFVSIARYQRPEFKSRLYSFTLLWVTLKIGWAGS